MNRSSNGENSPGEEPIRSKREMSRGREETVGNRQKNHSDLRYKRVRNNGDSFGNGDGSRHNPSAEPPGGSDLELMSWRKDPPSPQNSKYRARTGGQTHVSAEDTDQFKAAEPSKKKKRRRGKRRKNRQTEDPSPSVQLRNLRAPAKPSEDVTFDPSIVEKKNRRRKRNKSIRNPSTTFEQQTGTRTQANNKRPGRQRWERSRDRDNLYAALDLGTNNCRLLVAMPQEVGRFRVVDAFSRIVRLGEGLDKTGRLSDAAMQRSVDALKICAGKLRNKGIKRFRLIATEACRQAENGEDFLERVRNEIGLKLEIVNRETEARLAAEGCGALMDKKADGAVLFDIGGGSSELILIDRGKKSQRGKPPSKRRITDRIAAWTSLPMGVVTLAERFGGREVSRQVFESMVDDVISNIEKFEGKNQLSELWGNGRVHLLGTSGTVTTIAGVHLKLPKYDRRKVDGVWLKSAEIDKVITELIDMDFAQRAGNPCIGKDRADLVLAGCAILQAIRKTWPCERLRVADRGLREGLLTEMISRDGAWISPKRGRWRGRSNGQKRIEQTHQPPFKQSGRGDANG